MLKKLILLGIIGGLVYLNYTNPTREDHEALLFAELQALGPIADEQFAAVLEDVDYSNFMICSATKTSLDSKMISLGYLGQTRMTNDLWAGQVMKKLRGPRGY